MSIFKRYNKCTISYHTNYYNKVFKDIILARVVLYKRIIVILKVI